MALLKRKWVSVQILRATMSWTFVGKALYIFACKVSVLAVNNIRLHV